MFSVLNNCRPAAANLVLTRAYSAQQLAQRWQLGTAQQNQFFLTGLISGVDVLFGVPPTEFIQGLNLAPQITQAIINGCGEAARALALVTRIEQAYSMKLAPADIPPDYFSLYNQQQFEVQEKFRLLSS